MTETHIKNGPLAASPEEAEQLQALNSILAAGLETTKYFLADSVGNRIALPPSIFQILVAVARELAQGHSVAILHYDHELTTQQAAELLQVSRPYLIRLLEEGQIRFHMVGSHRRVRMRDLMAYKQERDNQRRKALRDLRRVSEDLGLYDQEPGE